MQNFGKINETFKDVFANSITNKSDKGKKLFKKYIKLLKEDKTLKTQYNVYSKLENKSKNDEEYSKLFVDECISMLSKLTKRSIIESNNKLIKLLNDNGYQKLSENYEYKELHEHINNLVLLDKNSKNINTIVESKIFLTKYIHLTEIKENTIVEPYSNKILIPLLSNKFNEKFKNLSELEHKAIKLSIRGSLEEKKVLYETTINECVDLVNEQLTECTIDEKNTLLQVKDKLLRYKFNNDKFVSEISELNYLNNTLKA